jgi:cytochrome c peroxidase
MINRIFIAIAVLTLISCDRYDLDLSPDQPYDISIPAGFDEIDFPEDNVPTVHRVELGKRLFFDTRLSRDETISCASCHHQELAFTDGLPTSLGIENRAGLRNAPTLANVAWAERLFMDGGVPSLELQVLAPIASHEEMDFTPTAIVERLKGDQEIQYLSHQAYGRAFDPYVLTRAIASFERTLVSANSKFDKFVFQGNEAAFNESEKLGYQLFQSDELQCSSCHTGFNLSDNKFHNVGLYLDYLDNGRERITLDANDIGKFKTPTLRNVALTAPYMHDGSLETLEEVIEHFKTGGVGHINQAPQIGGFELSDQEASDLIAFLNCLTDQSFIGTN